jgi:hypothetical protein
MTDELTKDIYIIPYTGIREESLQMRHEIITGSETDLPFTGITDIPGKRKVLPDFSAVRKINLVINITNYIFTIILSLITLRLSFLIFGVKDNIIYKITDLLLFPVFHLSGTFPSVSTPHVERESLVAIVLYAIIVSFISILAGLVKKIIRKRSEK